MQHRPRGSLLSQFTFNSQPTSFCFMKIPSSIYWFQILYLTLQLSAMGIDMGITRGQGFCQAWYWQTFKSLVSNEDRNLPVREALLQNRATLEKKKNRSSYEEDELDSVIIALSTYDGLSPECQYLVGKSEAWGVYTPTLFEFCVGEHPWLPILGRHFRNCNSKTGFRGKAEEVIRRLHGILEAHFPGKGWKLASQFINTPK